MNTQLTEHPRLQVEMVLTSLYLRGAPRMQDAPRHRAFTLFESIKNSDLPLEKMILSLHQAGYVLESKILENKDLLTWSKKQILSRNVMTFASQCYPKQWIDKLRFGAPAALWKKGDFPTGLFIGVVGSQNILPPDQNFSFESGRQIIRLQYSLVSGGAKGADTEAARGALEMLQHLSSSKNHSPVQQKIVEILPYGLNGSNSRLNENNLQCEISLCNPDGRFSTAHAMERNILIYALSEATIVVRARLYQGGSWHGAISALKRNLTSILVQNDPSDPGMLALLAKGGHPLDSPSLLHQMIQWTVQQKIFP